MTAFEDRIQTPPLVFVLSGPSGVGKTSLCDRLVADVDDAVYSRSVTTRPKRPGETHGEEYFFLSEEEFRELESTGQLLESACVHGHHYGTPRRFVEERLAEDKIVVLNIDVQGGLQLMSSVPDGVFVFVMPPSIDELVGRIRSRGGDTDAAITVRMSNVAGEIAEADKYTYIVVNDDFEECLRKLHAILIAERCLRRRCYAPQPAARVSARRIGG